jgi:hypothetical protein
MINRRLPLKDRAIVWLTTRPQQFSMAEFSFSTRNAKTFCLAGLILELSGVRMAYSDEGIATALKKGEAPPSPRWIAFELSLSVRPMSVASVTIAAKARELWAAEHGADAAELLPFYAADWEVKQSELGSVTAEQVIEVLQVVNLVVVTRATEAA